MTIKTDKWIKIKSDGATHMAWVNRGRDSRRFNFSNCATVFNGVLSPKVCEDLVSLLMENYAKAMVVEGDAHVLAIALADQNTSMIVPFSSTAVREAADGAKILSKGVSSFGYDVSLTETVKLFVNINAMIIDPKRFDEGCLTDARVQTDVDGARFVMLPPNSYMLGETVERFTIPRNVMVVCLGKSTYARSGVIINCTPIEAGFEGKVVIEASNATTLPAKIYLNEGIAQFLFFESDEECEVSYADRNGKYQGQTGVTLSKV